MTHNPAAAAAMHSNLVQVSTAALLPIYHLAILVAILGIVLKEGRRVHLAWIGLSLCSSCLVLVLYGWSAWGFISGARRASFPAGWTALMASISLFSTAGFVALVAVLIRDKRFLYGKLEPEWPAGPDRDDSSSVR